MEKNLEKLFVLVPAAITDFAGATVSAAAPKKIFFEEAKNTIWVNGVAYGIDPVTAQAIAANTTAIGKLQTLIGAAEKAEGVDNILVRLAAVEQATSKPIKIAEGEKVLALDADNNLSSALSIAIEKQGEGEAAKEYIVLKGIDGAEVAKADASAFVKDGMIDTVAWKEGEPNVLVITWNTDAGKTATEVDMSKFIDTYTVAADSENYLGIAGYEVSAKVSDLAEDATGLAKAADVWAADESMRGDIQQNMDNISLMGTLLAGYNDPAMTEEAMERYFEKNEEGDWIPNGKAALADVYNAQAAQHSHANKAVLDGITAEKVAAWDEAADEAHEHENKALLDTYTQTEANLADAVAKKHEHENADELDLIAAGDVAKWNAAAEASHEHDNKELLDTYTQTEADLADAVAKKHEHEDAEVESEDNDYIVVKVSEVAGTVSAVNVAFDPWETYEAAPEA